MPLPVGLLIVLAFGYPVFRNVIEATLRRQVVAHTVMTIGVLAALAVGQWATAAVVVFFMRVGDFAEHFTTERGRRAIKDLMALAPQTARVERDEAEVEVPIAQVRAGDIVIVRPGETIPVDGEVIAGQATVNQATITGEAMPVEAGPGTAVFAATQATLGSLRIRTTRIGKDTPLAVSLPWSKAPRPTAQMCSCWPIASPAISSPLWYRSRRSPSWSRATRWLWPPCSSWPAPARWHSPPQLPCSPPSAPQPSAAS